MENGYRLSVTNLKLYSDDTAEGYYEIGCHSGYRLNEAFGGRIICLESGEWSEPRPECICKFIRLSSLIRDTLHTTLCLAMGSCLISELFDFIRTTEGIRVDRENSNIYTNGVDETRAIGGSNITINCRDGYENIGGSPLIECTEQNRWTPFPQCVAIPSLSTPDPSSLRCPINDRSWDIDYGYLSQTRNLLVFSDNTANGNIAVALPTFPLFSLYLSFSLGSVVVSCSAGYTVDPVSGGVWTCNDGEWSPKPYCISK